MVFRLKFQVEDLALFGGKTTFDDALHVGRPNLGNREHFLGRVNDILDRRWFTNNGIYVQEFEQRIADMIGVRNCVAICNATVALEIAIRALELKGEVIIPSFTFVATAHALQWQEITPVFGDVSPGTHHLDPDQVEKIITPRTSAIIPVHVWGMPCDIDRFQVLGDKYNLRILYDAAHAIGSSYKGTMIGNFGDAEVFSFHATKFINAFEGGAVVTNDDELANKIRFTRNFGFAGLDDVRYLGTNGKMSEVSAAMGITSLESMSNIIHVNRDNFHRYQQKLTNIDGIKLFTYPDEEKQNYQYIIVEIEERQAGISRDRLVSILQAENILARRYFYPGCHEMEPYRSYFPHAGLLLPNTNQLTRRVLSLPTGTAVAVEDIDQICELISFCINHSDEIVSMAETPSL